jgi:hypothetical protein
MTVRPITSNAQLKLPANSSPRMKTVPIIPSPHFTL